MVELLSPSAKKRLPAAIQKLGDREQTVFVFLRMKRDAAFIAREIGAPLNEVNEMVRAVQEALAKSGSLDLVQDPKFYSIDQPGSTEDGGTRSMEFAGDNMDLADRMDVDRFYETLKKSLDTLTRDELRLLSLWFNKEMKAKEILGFYKNLGTPISPRKPIEESTEQDVFYALEKNIQKLTEIVRSNMKHSEEGAITPAGLRAILDETGV